MTDKIILKDAFKQYTTDQDKVMPPEETVARFKEKLSRLNLKILDKTIRIDNGRLDIPVYFSVCGSDAVSVIGTEKQMGKGGTHEQAEASAVMELAERYSFFSFCKNPGNFKTRAYRDLDPDEALGFHMIARSVHDETGDLEVNRRVFENIPLKWTRAYNLTRDETCLIPFSWFFAINEFNGPSAGNCLEEALSQGICEIVERHVSALVSRDRVHVDGISPASATDPLVKEMIQKYNRAGVRLYISDFTLGMGIPSVGVMGFDPMTFPDKSEIVWTAGTAPDPQKAMSRALTEVAQLAGDFNTSANYVASGLPKYSDLKEAGFITQPEKQVKITDLPDISNDNIKIEVQNCIAALADNQMDVIVVDTTHPDLKIPAFYTVIPGAHFRERAMGTSVGMFSAKLISENSEPDRAIRALGEMETHLPGRYYIQFYIGTCHLAKGDPSRALGLFQAALDLNPQQEDVPSIYTYMGICLKDLGKYREALSVLEKSSRLDPDRPEIHNLMGYCHFKLKAHPEAIQCFKQVLRLNPTSAIDYANIASNYREMGKTEKAVQYYEMALEFDSGINFASEGLARLQKKQNLETGA